MDMNKYTREEGNSQAVSILKGKAVDIMPIARMHTLFSTAQNIDLRNNAFESRDKKWIQEVCYNHLDSTDGIIYHPKGQFKIVWDCPNLRNLTQESELERFDGWNALNLEKEQGAKVFDEFPDEVDGVQLLFTHGEIKEYTGRSLKEEELINNKFWLAFVRGDTNRLGTYAQNIYSRINEKRLMKVSVADSKPRFVAEKLWCLESLDNNSDIDGYKYGMLDSEYGRFGVLPITRARFTKNIKRTPLEYLLARD